MTFFWGGGVRKEVAIHSQAIKYNCSAWLPTSLTPQQSNSNDMGDDNGNKMAGNKVGNGKGGKSNGDSDKGGGQAMKRATVRV